MVRQSSQGINMIFPSSIDFICLSACLTPIKSIYIPNPALLVKSSVKNDGRGLKVKQFSFDLGNNEKVKLSVVLGRK